MTGKQWRERQQQVKEVGTEDHVRIFQLWQVRISQFSRSVESCSLWSHGLQHARPPCSSPIPGVYSNSCSLSRWCRPTISSSVAPFFSCPQSFPASGSFPMSQLFTSGGQSIGASVSASVLLMNIQGWFHLELTGVISLLSNDILSRENSEDSFCPPTQQWVREFTIAGAEHKIKFHITAGHSWNEPRGWKQHFS